MCIASLLAACSKLMCWMGGNKYAGMELVVDQGDVFKGKVSREDISQLCIAASTTESARNATFEVRRAGKKKRQREANWQNTRNGVYESFISFYSPCCLLLNSTPQIKSTVPFSQVWQPDPSTPPPTVEDMSALLSSLKPDSDLPPVVSDIDKLGN